MWEILAHWNSSCGRLFPIRTVYVGDSSPLEQFMWEILSIGMVHVGDSSTMTLCLVRDFYVKAIFGVKILLFSIFTESEPFLPLNLPKIVIIYVGVSNFFIEFVGGLTGMSVILSDRSYDTSYQYDRDQI